MGSVGPLSPWPAPVTAICPRCSRGSQGSLGGAGLACARAAVPPPYPKWADDPLLPKPRAHPLCGIIFCCCATNHTDRQPSVLGGDGWSPGHPGEEETRLPLRLTGTERFAKGFLICGAFARRLSTSLPAVGPGSLHTITKEPQRWLMEMGLRSQRTCECSESQGTLPRRFPARTVRHCGSLADGRQ